MCMEYYDEEYDKEVEMLCFSPLNKRPHNLGGAAICVECASKSEVQEKHSLPPSFEWGPGEGQPNYIELNSPMTCYECGEKCFKPP